MLNTKFIQTHTYTQPYKLLERNASKMPGCDVQAIKQQNGAGTKPSDR